MVFSSGRLSRRHFAALTLLGLGGCGAFGPDDVACPPVSILPDAARLVRYADGNDLTDVLYEVTINRVTPVCQRSSKELLIDLALVLTARRGPALPEGNAEFSYFVAVTAADQQLLARQVFPVSMPLDSPGRRVQLTELVQPKIPLTEDQSQFSYRVFIGLVLTPDELRQNRGG